MKIKITVALLALITSSAFAAMPAAMPVFKNEQQLAQWRAELVSKKHQVTSNEGHVFFTGKPYIESTGSYTFNYRSYKPELARWTSEDPSGFPDGANNLVYAPNPGNELDPDGLRVQWIGNESTFSPNQTYQALAAATFNWNISLNGVVQSSGSFTGTFQQLYANASTVGFVTWRGLTTRDFGVSQSLTLYGHSLVNGVHTWTPNGYTVSAGFLENAGASDADLAAVNARINPIEAETSRATLRGVSGFLHTTLLSAGAGYNGDLYYE